MSDSSLLGAVKRYLNISYDDDMTDEMLADAIATGKVVIDGYAGGRQDYDSPGMARQLLMDYCRYVRSQATEMFQVNYGRDLLSLREYNEIQAVGVEEDE